ncbi:Purine catabolism protein PucB [compost metagenome]
MTDLLPAPPVTALLLAAGYSTRFGSDKRKATLEDGRSLLTTSLTLPCSLLDEVWVVLRPDDSPEELELPSNVRIVQDDSTTQGMGHSIACGIRRLTASSSAESVAIFLGDMPSIRTQSFEALLRMARRDNIVIPTCNDVRGHPVLFGREFWPALCQLQGDKGAKGVIEQSSQAQCLVALDDPGIIRDIDTPEDLQPLA